MKKNLIIDVNSIKTVQLIEMSKEEIILTNGGDQFLLDLGRAVGNFFGFIKATAGTIRPSEYR